MVVFLILLVIGIAWLLAIGFTWLHNYKEKHKDDNLTDEAWNEKYNR